MSFGAAGSSGYDAGASTAVENQSAALLKTQMKKVLTFRLFKRLKEVKQITDMFTIGEELGKGSFGKVMRCVNKNTGMQCAIKIVNKSHIGQH
jgi:serine/threonine protein kinase